MTLSYILTTRNKLPYLKETISALIETKGKDEEILVADGGSTDGSAQYLADLKEKGTIDVLISEPDQGEAHGFNKLLLVAKGELIKLITDDDAFYYPGIRECKAFMLAHPMVDFLATDGVKVRNNARYPFIPMLYQSQYEEWAKSHTPFAFCGLGIMFRKSSLPLLGLLDTTFSRVDAEYSLRTTAGKVNIAWYALECFGHILNEKSNSKTQRKRATEEMKRLEILYFGKSKRPSVFQYLRVGIERIKNLLSKKKSAPLVDVSYEEWREMFHSSQDWLIKNATQNKGGFLYRK